MPTAIVTAIMFVGNLVMTALPIIEVVFGIGGGTMFVTGALAITAGVVGMSKLMEMSLPRPDSNFARQKTVRTTTAPVKRVYGESLISGPVAFLGVGGNGNQDLWHVIALTGDKSEAITDIYLDNIIIPNADINSGNALGGVVNGTTTIFKPIDSTTLVTVYKYTGGQTAASMPVTSEFFKWTSDHKGQGLTYIATKFSFPDNEKIAEVWNKYNPQDIKALVKGMAIYDPRKDSTSDEYDSGLGVSTQRLADSTTWQWSDNPALCLANYIIDDEFGMGVPSSAMDWAAVHSAADNADALVSISASETQKRFTCNGVLYGTDSHAQNVNKILSSMNGSLVYSSGKYVMQSGQYIAPESDAILTDNDLTGPISITVANTRDSRFNTIKGTHFNPADLHKKVAFPEVQLTDIATRDAGEVLYKEVELPMTNDVYMCQRLTYQMISRSNDQMLIEFPCNLKALRYTVGDRVKVTLDKFAGSDQDSISFNQTPFVVLGFNFSAEGAVNLTLLKDTQANYADIPYANYSVVTSDGSITDGFSGVPAPTNLDSVVDGHFVRLTWDNPVPNTTFNDIIVYQSSTSNFSDSSILLRTKNDAITFSLPSAALTKYYWVRASLYDNEVAATDIIIGQTYRIRSLGTTSWTTLGATAPVNNGDTFLATASGTSSSGTGVATDESAVSAVVGPETVTTTDQVADSVEWVDVDNTAGLRPSNNATVGATLGTNVYDGQAQAYAVGDLLNSNGFFRFTRTSADDNVDAPASAAAFNTAFGRAPTDGDIVVVTNTTSSPNKQAAYQYDGSTFGTISGFFAGDLIIDDTITAAAISVDDLGAINANLGTITGGTLKGGTVPDADAAPSGTESGSFFDLTGGKFVVGNATNNLLFDASALTVTGTVNASAGEFTGSVSIGSNGAIYGGTMDSFNDGSGFFLGYETGAYKLSVGNSSGEVLTWDGSKLNVEANTVSFMTGNEQVYSSVSRLPPGVVSATRTLVSNSDYFYFDSDIDVITPAFVVSYNLGALTSGSVSGQSNSRNAILSTIKLEMFYAAASYSGTPGTWTLWDDSTFTTSTLGQSEPSMSDNTLVVQQVDLGGGNWETKLLTREQYRDYANDDYYSSSFTPNDVVDDEYYLNWRVQKADNIEWPAGTRFIKIVATVTNGSYTPYPATGSPSTSETRIVSIPGGTVYQQENHGLAIALGGQGWDHATRYLGINGQTVLSGGEVIIGAPRQNPGFPGNTASLKLVGFDADTGTIRKLSAIEFHNGLSTLNGSPEFGIYVPNAGDVLAFAGNANFNNNVDVDGTLSINGVTVNAGAVTGPAGSDTQVQFNNSGSLGASSAFTFNDATDTLAVTNLTVSGTTTSVNVADLNVVDKDITLNYATGDSSSSANNAGIIIQDAVSATNDASILWKTATDSFEFSHPVTVNSSLNLRSDGGEAGIYLQDSSASNATAFKIYADVTLATSTLYIDYDPSVAGNNWAFVNNGNFLASGTIYADGAASNSLQWETGYDYSQIGHLPLAGGTLTGAVSWPSGSSTNANTAYTYSQVGHLPLTGGTLTGNLAVNPSSTVAQINVGDSSQTDYTNLLLHAADGTGTQSGQMFKVSDTYTGWGGADSLNIYTSKGTINFHPAGQQDRFVVESGRVYTKNAYLLVGNNGTTNSYATVATGRIYFGGLNTSYADSYSIGAGAKEDVGGDYTKLDIQWHTGIRIGASSGYGGTRFYNDAMDASSTEVKIFSVGETDNSTKVYYDFNVSGQTNLTDKLDVKKTGADTIVDIRGNASFDPVLNLRSDQGAITTEGFQIWYDNSVGDVHLHTTHPVEGASAIRFHTATGTNKATNNERFTIHGNGLVNIVSGSLAMGGNAVITNDRSLFPTSIEVIGSYSGGSGDKTNITNAQLKISSAGTDDYWRIPHLSTSSTISGVYNYQTGKDVYWGEPTDTGNYLFRGRDFAIEDGVLKMGTATAIDASRNLTVRNITATGGGGSPHQFLGTGTIVYLNIGGATQTQYSGMSINTDDGDAQFFKAGSGYSGWGGADAFNIYNSNGPLAFHPSAVQNVLKLTSAEISAGRPIRVTGPGSVNIYEGVIKTLNSSTDQWAHLVLGGSATNTIVNNYYMIGRGNSIAAREMTFHIPKAVNYGATDTTQPKFRFVSSGDVTLMTITADTGAVYIKGALSPSSISSGAITSTGAMTLSADTTHVINLTAASGNNSRGISFNSKVALSASQDGWLRLNQNSQFTNGVYTPLGLRADGGVDSYTGYKVLGSPVIDASRNFLGVGGSFSNNVYIAGTTANGLSIGETATNYASWDRQLTLNGTGHARMHVKTTAGIQMGMYAHDTWLNSGGGYLGTYNNYKVTFIINAASAGYIDTSKRFTWQHAMLIGGEWSNNSYNSVSATTLAFGGGTDLDNYSVGTSLENYNGNYTKLNLKWHTGIKFFAMSTYGGVRFFDDAAMASEVMSIGKGDDHVRVANNLYVTGSLASTGASFTSTVNITNTGAAFTGLDIGSSTQTSYSLIRLNSNNGNFQAWKAGTTYSSWGGVNAMNIYTSYGDLCFHPSGTQNLLRLNSSGLLTTGNVTAYYSDMRLKTRTGGIDNALEKVNSLSGFKYVENDLAKELGYSNDKQQVGLSAQQIQAVLPEAVSLAPIDYATDEHTGEVISKSGQNYLTVDYAKLVPLLVEAIKELTQEVESLKTKLKEK